MSKLPNAPLLEVIFEIKWQTVNQNDIVEFQYLHGDLYAELKSKYPFRENTLPPEIPMEAIRGIPNYRFRKVQSGYPLVQLGLGILSVNTTEETYYWDDFKKEIEFVLDSFTKTFQKSESLNFTPNLTYIDFFAFNMDNEDPVDFINNNFNLNISQSFLKIDDANNCKEAILLLNYNIGADVLSLNLRNGAFNNKIGLVLETKIIGFNGIYTRENLSEWINRTHIVASEVFKNIVKKDLYKTFN